MGLLRRSAVLPNFESALFDLLLLERGASSGRGVLGLAERSRNPSPWRGELGIEGEATLGASAKTCRGGATVE